jgi:uncharacterized protein YyaL (SSP411 family)
MTERPTPGPQPPEPATASGVPREAGDRGSAPHPFNRLAGERSVYLQQHARNPVDWHPWGAEAIEAARARGVPLLVSVGYSTCYWCHVMERESFEDAATAEILNRVCVPVKVDREERPDLDDALMTACQVFTQLTEGRASGGWPLNAFLHPETLEPFFCGTYFPPRSAHGRPGFADLLRAVDAAWRADPAGLRAQGARIAALARAHLEPGGERAAEPHALADPELARELGETILRAHDPEHGGFGGAPKFPTPPYLSFLLETRRHEPGVARALQRTLDRMAVGGLRDQVGGGFHRYCVDAEWTVPHFEKMLYDNALLAVLYTRAAAEWGDAFFARVARETLQWILREMTGEHGQFFSAQDAEVDGREGANYLWTPEEVRGALAASADDAAFAVRVYGLDRGPNFRDPHHPHAPPANVLRMDDRPDRVAAALGVGAAEFAERLARVNAALLSARAARPRPLTDDKTIAAWTGLAIEAFALAGRALAEPRFTAAASRAARFVLERMRDPDGGLLRIWRGGSGAGPAFLEDYACVANGLIALGWEREAADLMRRAHAEFADAATGAWHDVAAGRSDLWARGRSLDDGALPSGTSSALRALVALAGGDAADRGEFRAWAHALAAAVAPAVLEQPVSASGTVLAARRLAALEARDAPVDPVALSLHWTPGARDAVLALEIAPGHHVTTGDAFAVEAVEGTPVARAEPDGGGAAWTGRVRVPVRFADPPDAPPALRVTWQVCTDRACLPPCTAVVRAATLPRAP